MEQKLNVTLNALSHLNYSMQQNGVPFIRSVVVTNITDEAMDNLTLKISFSPEFSAPYEIKIDRLPTNQPIEISPVKTVISTEFLTSLTEQLYANIHIEVLDGQTELFITDTSVYLLACGEWSGIDCFPETIAAFVTPNHPSVSAVALKAASYLEKWTGSSSFTGYQTQDPNVAKLQAASLYAALQSENIAYTVGQPSFREAGQRIRFSSEVLEQKCGNCLDLAALYCSCLERVGLNSLIVFLDGHAFAGVWLENETFCDCCEDDVSAITKRAAQGVDKLCFIETTAFTAGKNIDFDAASKNALFQLEKNESFRLAVDIARTRASGIRPVSQTQDEGSAHFEAMNENKITAAPAPIDLSLHGTLTSSHETTKQAIWERKLLDMSLRNNLLNFRPRSSNIQLLACDLAELEDEIATGAEFRIISAPSDFSFSKSESGMFAPDADKDAVAQITKSEFASKRIRSFIKDAELEKIMKKLQRQAKVSLEENGANTLYLALGFLRWFENDKSVKPRYAPIALVPVDIVRKIQDKTYSIRAREEDMQINITLLEMLRQDFGIDITGLNPVPSDEKGYNIPLIFSTVRQGVMSKKNWDIEELAFVGQFSFSRFIMWNDIKSRSDDLATNKVVASLMSGKAEWEFEDIKLSAPELDDKVLPSDMAIPTSADSSQLAAIYEAAKGQSFVLHGPPGTGKSQTITNMIANALYNGKSVLFVAEKMAALSVVQKRLEKIGLAPFCLELHSNKAQKKSVLNQLERTLETGRIKAPEDYKAEAERLYALRKMLNETVSELHKKRNIGVSLYEAVTRCEELEGFDGKLDGIEPSFVSAFTPESYGELKNAVENFITAGKECGGYSSCALKEIHAQNYTMELRETLRTLCTELLEKLPLLRDGYSQMKAILAINNCEGFDSFTKIINLISRLSELELFLPCVLDSEKYAARKSGAVELLNSGERLLALNAEILAGFEPSVLDFDSDKAMLDWKKTQQKWAIGKHFGVKNHIKELSLYAKGTTVVTENNIVSLYEKLSERKKLNADITGANPLFTELFGAMWLSEKTNFTLLKNSLEASEGIAAMVDAISETNLIKQAVTVISSDNAAKVSLFSKTAEIRPLYAQAKEILSSLEEKLSADISALTSGDSWFESAKAIASRWLEGSDTLRDRVILENSVCELQNAGLGSVITSCESKSVSESELVQAFEYEVMSSVVKNTLVAVPSLSSFQGAKFEETIKRFKEADESFRRLTVEELCAKLSSKIPSGSAASASSSEVSILQRAIKSGGRMLSIRRLFDSIPTLLRRICPCMLMSPISVAQYIDPAYPKFDLVIFDEASQLPTCEAVGAIARGENVIVVGDPKQLPPTSFFDVSNVDEENYEKEDLESVLDDCLALSLPQTHLLWHYRSRHESLIAYSNAKYYENKLLTFPSPDDLVSKVSWVKVEGCYDKGGTKQNKAEAEAIVTEIVRRLRDENLRKNSIGVVTFSLPQQHLIDDLLTEKFSQEPELEFIANEMYEPLFIKNLENVQGDERDVILFSIGYGPDKDGKVSMNFGPLNRDGGWRRLNVAISRSRKEMVVYSVITPEQIDLTKTRSDGVAGLKGFLEFAAGGTRALPVNLLSKKDAVNRFAVIVSEEIEKLGYKTSCNIGTSEYKIDVGVLHPEKPDEFVLGIMCCGDERLDVATARDRCILQPSVLEGLGWSVANVHILDWLDNKNKVLGKLELSIREAIEKADGASQAQIKPKKDEPIEFQQEISRGVYDFCSKYEVFNTGTLGTADDFYAEKTMPLICETIRKVISTEAPVSKKLIKKRIMSAWDISRSTAKFEATFDNALQNVCEKSTVSNGALFFWKSETQPQEYRAVRVPVDEENRRSFDDISTEEIANAVKAVVETSVSVERDDVSKEVAHIFGFVRTSPAIDEAVRAAVEYAISTAMVFLDRNNRLTCAR